MISSEEQHLSYDINKISEWKCGDNIDFSILNDDISGRIPVLRVNSWRQFIELLETPFFNEGGSELIFRGHRRYDWSLMPTLARTTKNNLLTTKLIDNQLNYFRRAIRGRIKDNSLIVNDNEDEIWAIGQHYGLYTPLLDWTYSPYVALFFAFSKKDDPMERANDYRAVYIANKKLLQDEEIVEFIDPKIDIYGRLVNQAGLFMKIPEEQTIEGKILDELQENEDFNNLSGEQIAQELAKYICKIYIKNDVKEQRMCLHNLRKMNIHHASLFPDLIGAAEYCNALIEEEVIDKIDKIEHEIISDYGEKNEKELEISNNIIGIEKFLEQNTILGSNQNLKQISKNILEIFEDNKTTDWKEKDSPRAAMRVSWRRLLQQNDINTKNISGIISELEKYFEQK